MPKARPLFDINCYVSPGYTTTSITAGMTRQNIAHGYDSAPGSQPVDSGLGAMCGTACVDTLMESSSATLMFSTEESNRLLFSAAFATIFIKLLFMLFSLSIPRV